MRKDGSRVRVKALVVMDFTAEKVPLLNVPAALGCQPLSVKLMVTTECRKMGHSHQLSPLEGRVCCDFEPDDCI